MPISSEHTPALTSLPPLHKDPFDQLLIAQAQSECIALLGADAVVSQYGNAVIAI